MNRVLTCLFAGAMALSLQPAAALAQDKAPAAESKPVPLAGTKAADLMDLLAEGKDGDTLGVVADVVLDDSGNAKSIVIEQLKDEESVAGGEGEPDEGAPPADDEEGAPPADDEQAAEGPDTDVVAEDSEKAEPEAAPAEDEQGTEEPVEMGKLVAVSPKGAMLDKAREVIMFPSVTAAQFQDMAEFKYESGMKTVKYPKGYSAK